MTVVETLGWVLLHFAWQGAVAAAALWIALLLTPSGRASLRYVLGCAALLLMAMAPLATAMRLTASHVEPVGAQQQREDKVAANVGPSDTALLARHSETSASVSSVGAGSMRWAARRPMTDAVEPAIPWLVAGWALGVVLLSVRLLGGWWHMRSLRTQALSPVPRVVCRDDLTIDDLPAHHPAGLLRSLALHLGAGGHRPRKASGALARWPRCRASVRVNSKRSWRTSSHTCGGTTIS